VVRPREYSLQSVQSKIETAKDCLQIESGEKTLEGRTARGALQADASCRACQMGTPKESKEEECCRYCSRRRTMEQKDSRRTTEDHAASAKGPRRFHAVELDGDGRSHLRPFAGLLSGDQNWKSSRPLNMKVLGMTARDRNRKIFFCDVCWWLWA
jgi:hypothetical protein